MRPTREFKHRVLIVSITRSSAWIVARESGDVDSCGNAKIFPVCAFLNMLWNPGRIFIPGRYHLGKAIIINWAADT